MSVKLTGEVEAERVRRAAETREVPKWEIFRTNSLVEVSRKAKVLGWAEKKVQVRVERLGDYIEYVIEPYEEGCGCSGILKYQDIYGMEEENDIRP